MLSTTETYFTYRSHCLLLTEIEPRYLKSHIASLNVFLQICSACCWTLACVFVPMKTRVFFLPHMRIRWFRGSKPFSFLIFIQSSINQYLSAISHHNTSCCAAWVGQHSCHIQVLRLEVLLILLLISKACFIR